jgi:hypothetical protein
VAAQTGVAPPELEVPPCPAELAHVVAWYYELAGGRATGGFGVSGLPYAEIDAWSRLMQVALTPFEVHVLRRIDQAFVAVFAKAAE